MAPDRNEFFKGGGKIHIVTMDLRVIKLSNSIKSRGEFVL